MAHAAEGTEGKKVQKLTEVFEELWYKWKQRKGEVAEEEGESFFFF